MSGDGRVSEEMLGAFVDGQLDAAEWARVQAQVERDAGLREEVCRLRALKELIRHSHAVPPGSRKRTPGTPRPGWMALVASSLAFAVAGWFGHAQWSRPPLIDAASAYALRGDWHSLRSDWGSLQDGKVLVHVSSAGRDALGATLDEVEDLLQEAGASGRRIEVELVANGAGLDLLRAGSDAHASRIAALRAKYPGLSLVACAQTMDRRRARGESIELVPGAVVAPSALHQVVERLRAGWVYVRA